MSLVLFGSLVPSDDSVITIILHVEAGKLHVFNVIWGGGGGSHVNLSSNKK